MADRLLDFGVNLTGVDGPVAKLGLAESRVGDLRPAWDAIHAGRTGDPLLKGKGKGQSLSFLTISKRHFATQGGRAGAKWDGYDDEPVYRVIKRLFGGGEGRMLRWRAGRERLYPSLISPSHPDHIFEAKRHSVEIGTAVPYARNHQFGIGLQPFDRQPLKKRPVIALTRSDFRGWVRVIQRHVMRNIEPGARVGARGAAGRAGFGPSFV